MTTNICFVYPDYKTARDAFWHFKADTAGWRCHEAHMRAYREDVTVHFRYGSVDEAAGLQFNLVMYGPSSFVPQHWCHLVRSPD